jgi:Abnormal spindle-like microcephaly-assoc'd, ASPM-SPD-2-Hydin
VVKILVWCLAGAALIATAVGGVVVATGGKGQAAKPSAKASGQALPSAPPLPSSPDKVVATPQAGGIDVSWYRGTGAAVGFDVYRSTSYDVPLINPINGSTPLPSDTSTFLDPTTTLGRYFYVVQAVSASGVRGDPSDVAQAKLGAPAISLLAREPVLYAARNSGSVSGAVRVSDIGDQPLTVTSAQLAGGRELSLASTRGFTLAPGAHRDLTFTFKPSANGPQRASLQVASNDPNTPTATVGLGGLAIDNTTTSEPSLQWILDAYGITVNDGDSEPSSYSLDTTRIPPTGGALVTAFTRLDPSLPVHVTALAAFVNPATAGDPSRDPTWGWMPANTSPGTSTASFSVRRGFLGARRTIAPEGRFGLWARAEGTTLRTDLNTSAKPRFIAFPVSGSPGAYVVADDTTGRTTDDWNDLPLLIDNVSIVS